MASLITINNLCLMLIVLINAGSVFRIIMCCIQMSSGEPQKVVQMKDRIKKILIFVAIANGILGLHQMAIYYYGG